MKGYDLHDSELKEITVGGEINKVYKQLIDLLKSKNKEITLESMFIAGYMLSNPILRDNFKMNRNKEMVENLHFN